MANLPAIPPGAPPKIPAINSNTFVIFGDSNTASHWGTVTTTSAVRTSGVVTVTATSHPFMTGTTVAVEQASDATVNGLHTVTRTGTNTYTFVSPGADGAITGAQYRYPQWNADIGWATWWRMYMGASITLLNNAGRGGDNTTQMLARIQSDVLAYRPANCTVMGGTNDVIQGVATATIIANLLSIYSILRRSGVVLYAMTVYPIPSGYSGWTAAWNQSILDVNAAIRNECLNNPNTILIDAYEAMVDPISTQGNPRTNYLQSTSNVHTTGMGAQAVGYRAFLDVGDRIAKVNALAVGASDNRSISASNTNIFRYLPSVANGGTVGGTATGTPPTGTKVESTAGSPIVAASSPARTVANDGDDCGFNVRMEFTSNAANDAARMTNADTSYYGSLTIGKAYYWESTINVSGLSGSNAKLIDMSVRYVVDGVSYYTYCLQSNGTTFPTTDFRGVVQTAPFFLTGSTVTGAVLGLDITASATGSKVTIDSGRWTLRELPAGSALTY